VAKHVIQRISRVSSTAKEKGFVNLTEGDIARIVSDFRGGR